MFRLGVSTTLNPSHRSLPDRIRVAAYAAMAYWFYRWDWGESVAVDGLARAGRALDDRAFSDFVDCELERWVAQSRTTGSPNPMGPAVALLDAVGEQRMADESAARECLDRLAERLHNEQPDSRGFRTRTGPPTLVRRLALRAPGLPRWVQATRRRSSHHCGRCSPYRRALPDSPVVVRAVRTFCRPRLERDPPHRLGQR